MPASGVLFCVLNAVMRGLAQQIDPFQAQFLRYLAGLVVILPLVLRSGGIRRWWPRQVGGQFVRGALHTAGLTLWFIALPRIPLADMTAIGFTTPIFIMLGALLVFREPMRWERWLACGFGFAGVLIVVGPKLSGGGWRLQPGDARLGAAVRRVLPGHQGADALREHRRDPALAGDHRQPAQPAAGAAALADADARCSWPASWCAACSATAPTTA